MADCFECGGDVVARYPIPLDTSRVEFNQKNSIFIGTAGPAPSLGAANMFIAAVRTEFPDAHHHVWAYLVGFGPNAVTACHNDGEPGGTAGPPALTALQGSGLGDVVAVVTRYFGGVKLGTGGLARAYGRAARDAVAALSRGQKVTRQTLSIQVSYAMHDTLRRLLDAFEGEIVGVDYTEQVVFDLSIPVDRMQAFASALKEASSDSAIILAKSHNR